MINYDNSTPGNKFDGIILTFEKGGICWPAAEHPEAISFDSLGDFDRFTVAPMYENAEKAESWAFLENLKKRYDKRNLGNESDSCNALFGLTAMPGSGDFWDTETPYTFVSLIQFGDKPEPPADEPVDKNLDILKGHYEDWKINHPGQFDYFIYRSMDISDYFVFIKTSTMKVGNDCIFKLSKTLKNNFYSYSRCGFNKEKLKDSDELVERLAICFAVKNPKEFEAWLERWYEKYDKDRKGRVENFDRLGHEGISLNIKDIKMRDIIKEWTKGLLCQETYDAAIMRPRIIFDTRYISKQVDRPSSPKPTILKKYMNLVKVSKSDQNIESNMESSMMHALRNMYKAVGMLEDSNFGRDIVCCVNSTFGKFIEELKKENDRIVKDLPENSENFPEPSKIKLHSHLCDYIDANMSLIKGSLQADTMFFQVPGFRIPLYEIQSKLVVLYMAFMKQLNQALEGSGKKFGVVLKIGLHNQMIVKELFSINDPDSFDNGAFLCIEVPVSLLFEPQRLIPQLVHEISHFNSIKFRCRAERKNRIVYSISALITANIFKPNERMLEKERGTVKEIHDSLFKTQDDARSFAEFVNNHIINFFEEKLEQIFKIFDEKHGRKATDEFKLIRQQLQHSLEIVLKAFVSPNNLENAIGKMYDALYSIFNPSPSDLDYFMSEFDIFAKLTSLKVRMIGNFSVRQIFSLMEQSFSDLIMLKVCKLEKEDYLKEFAKTIGRFARDEEEYEKGLVYDYTLQRICAVFKVHYKKGSEYGDVWKFIDEYQAAHPSDEEFARLADCMKRQRDSKKQRHLMLVDNTVAYLKECCKAWDEEFKDRDRNDKLEKVQDLFQDIAYAPTLTGYSEAFRRTYETFVYESLTQDA